MNQRLCFAPRAQRGFTLLELLVVLVVLGLLAGIVAPKYFAQLGRSEVKVAKAQIEGLGKALDLYRLEVDHQLADDWKLHFGYSFNRETYDASQVRVGPGMVGGEVNRRLAPLGKKISPDPASIGAAKIGGIAANNASGMCCGTAQNSYKTLAGLRVMLADGTLLDTEDPLSIAAFSKSHAVLLGELERLGRDTRANAALAKRMERAGADAVIAEGCESGGHIGERRPQAVLLFVVDQDVERAVLVIERIAAHRFSSRMVWHIRHPARGR